MTRAHSPLADTAGRYAMVALDHRESLRTMMGGVPDARLHAFKRAGVDVLAPHATAVLLDRHHSLLDGDRSGLPEGTALILAADQYAQDPGGPVRASTLDEGITPELTRACGAGALKLLVHWDPGGGREHRADLLARFAALSRRCGTAAVVEGIVRVDPGQRDEAVLAAAAELCELAEPELYEAEVPGYRPGDVSRVREWSERLTAVVGRPWVVLSSGVRREDFDPALREACAGGAAGFLAGRAVWSDLAPAPDPAEAFRRVALPRLQALAATARAMPAGAR